MPLLNDLKTKVSMKLTIIKQNCFLDFMKKHLRSQMLKFMGITPQSLDAQFAQLMLAILIPELFRTLCLLITVLQPGQVPIVRH